MRSFTLSILEIRFVSDQECPTNPGRLCVPHEGRSRFIESTETVQRITGDSLRAFGAIKVGAVSNSRFSERIEGIDSKPSLRSDKENGARIEGEPAANSDFMNIIVDAGWLDDQKDNHLGLSGTTVERCLDGSAARLKNGIFSHVGNKILGNGG